MQNFLEILRPKMWLKNILLFVPLFFSTELLDLGLLGRVLIGAVIFSLMSAAVYIANDIFDKDKDAKDSALAERPIIKGSVGTVTAATIAVVLGAFAAVASFIMNPEFGLVLLAYLLLGLWYSAWLQNVAIIDSLALSTMLVLRVVAGALLVGVTVSPFLVLLIGIGGLAFVFRNKQKQPSKLYTPEFLAPITLGLSTASIALYAIYALLSGEGGTVDDNSFIYSTIIVAFIFLRLAYNAYQTKQSESSKKLKMDMVLAAGVVVYILYLVSIFYLSA